jgi:Domain of unknown function (DUF4267)
MKQQSNLSWGARSLSFWITFTIAAGIIFVGIRFIISPMDGAAGFGIPFTKGWDISYGRIKGIRDIFSGLVFFYPLWTKNVRVTAFLFATATIIPATDCLIVLNANGAGDIAHLAIHGGTALVMLLNSILLFSTAARLRTDTQISLR